MSGERPWWFPTAAFVVPVVVALVAADVVVNAFSERDASPLDVGAIAAVVLLHVHLARAEDRWREIQRPPDLDRWGIPQDEAPGWWRRYWASVAGRLAGYSPVLVALALTWTVAWLTVRLRVASESAYWLAYAVTIGTVIVTALIDLGRERFPSVGSPRLPLLVKRLVWRWPGTARVLSVEWLASSAALALWMAARGEWMTALVFAANLLWSLSAVFELRNPRSKWRNYGSEPTEGALG